jgi:hypothetical protein
MTDFGAPLSSFEQSAPPDGLKIWNLSLSWKQLKAKVPD